MKKKLIIIIAVIVSFFAIIITSLLIYYDNSLTAIGTNKEITFTIESGSTSTEIINNLEQAGLIKNATTARIYLKLHETSLQAGDYLLNTNMSYEEILEILSNGETIDNSIKVTFVEGKRLTYYAEVISNNFTYTKEEVLEKFSNKEYLNELINDYWFITDDILNEDIYYPLEGYLAPNTYQFRADASIEEIITKLLNQTDKILTEHKEEIENSKYSIHEILTMASIVELEGATSQDRYGVAGVFYNRLDNNWSLGSDVTTYYAAQIDFSDRDLYQYELDDVNAYNTRSSSMAGKLPVGPICNVSATSIDAAINPTKHDYFYFVADKNGKTYFTKTYSEHNAKIAELQRNGLWYTY